MSTEEIIQTLEAVVRTMDSRFTISGISNMETVIGCTRAIGSVVEALKSSVKSQKVGESE